MATKTYGFIYGNCRDFADINTLCKIFYTLVRPRLEYGILVWYPVYNIHHLRRISSAKIFEVLVIYIDIFNFTSLQIRRDLLAVTFLFNLTTKSIVRIY